MFFENDAIQKTIKELDLSMPRKLIERKFLKAKPIELKRRVWKRIINIDYKIKTEQDAKNLLQFYNKDINKYDLILNEIKNDIWHPPLIIKFNRKTYYLVAGYIRLLVCKVNKIKPKVKIIENII